jgi:hypothetical protein
MPRRPDATALGFRVRSGAATAVLVAGDPAAPEVLRAGEIALCDPSVPETRQPYHADFGELESDRAVLARRLRRVRAAAARDFARWIASCRESPTPRRAGIVVGSLIDPAAIANPHIRAHALEGRLFRTVLQELLQAEGIATFFLLEKSAYGEAAARLGMPAPRLRQEVARLPRPAGPWRAVEKLAALGGWLALAETRGR